MVCPDSATESSPESGQKMRVFWAWSRNAPPTNLEGLAKGECEVQLWAPFSWMAIMELCNTNIVTRYDDALGCYTQTLSL
eukprot:1161167-Pelagomonas_calceolata.AAC.5